MKGSSEERLFFHSPFVPSHVQHEQNASLLLQFFLSALLSYQSETSEQISSPYSFFLYDRVKLGSLLDQLIEHATLFPYAFPSLKKETKEIAKILESLKKETKTHRKNEKITRLVFHLAPFLLQCKDNENLLFFLLKNQHKRKELQEFLTQVSLPGKTSLKKHLTERFKQRGFFSILAELEEILKNVRS